MKDVSNLELFVIVNPQGELIGLDTSSGGYPWVPNNFQEVRLWSSVELAAEYVAVETWNKPDHGWTIKRLGLSLTEITQDEAIVQRQIWDKRNGDRVK